MRYRVCASSDLTEGSIRVFEVGKKDVLLGRIGGRLFACNNSCPHRGASLALGEMNGNNIVCYMHGYEYDAFSGKLVNMKSWKKEDTWIEQSPEWRKSSDLTLYPVFEESEGIYVDVPNVF